MELIKQRDFTLIELMIAVADIANREQQYLFDNCNYASGYALINEGVKSPVDNW